MKLAAVLAPMAALALLAQGDADPSASNWLLLAAYLALALGVSFVCSVLEATLLSVRLPSLVERKERGDRGAALLLDLREARLDDAISAILTLNTVAHTLGSTLAGAQAAVVFGSRWVGVFSGVLTIVVLVATEIIPKTLGTAYASQLVGAVARLLRLLLWALGPMLRVTRLITGLFGHGGHAPVSKGEIAALVAMAAKGGTLRSDESRVVANVLGLERVRVRDAMTPRTVTTMLPETLTLEELIEHPRALQHSRLPLYGENRDQVTGYLLQREVLAAIARGASKQDALSKYRHEVLRVPEDAKLSEALRQMLQLRDHLAIVTDAFGGTSGLITLEDIVETILGIEIVDEKDRVEDMRKLAVELRDRRVASAPPGEGSGAHAAATPAAPAPGDGLSAAATDTGAGASEGDGAAVQGGEPGA